MRKTTILAAMVMAIATSVGAMAQTTSSGSARTGGPDPRPAGSGSVGVLPGEMTPCGVPGTYPGGVVGTVPGRVGCVPGQPFPGVCHVSNPKAHLGKNATAKLLERIKDESNAKKLRILTLAAPSTQEAGLNRVTVLIGPDGKIASVSCY